MNRGRPTQSSETWGVATTFGGDSVHFSLDDGGSASRWPQMLCSSHRRKSDCQAKPQQHLRWQPQWLVGAVLPLDLDASRTNQFSNARRVSLRLANDRLRELVVLFSRLVCDRFHASISCNRGLELSIVHNLNLTATEARNPVFDDFEGESNGVFRLVHSGRFRCSC